VESLCEWNCLDCDCGRNTTTIVWDGFDAGERRWEGLGLGLGCDTYRICFVPLSTATGILHTLPVRTSQYPAQHGSLSGGIR
jgi:hypothetical protein